MIPGLTMRRRVQPEAAKSSAVRRAFEYKRQSSADRNKGAGQSHILYTDQGFALACGFQLQCALTRDSVVLPRDVVRSGGAPSAYWRPM